MAHGNYGPDARRTEALARAAKMMKLFNKNCFKAIMETVDIDKTNLDRNAFDTACGKANPPLVPAEKDWLWSYLKNMTDVWQNVPDAANAGW
jgi:hypothetical protein